MLDAVRNYLFCYHVISNNRQCCGEIGKENVRCLFSIQILYKCLFLFICIAQRPVEILRPGIFLQTGKINDLAVVFPCDLFDLPEQQTSHAFAPLAENYWEKDSATDVFCYSEPIDPAEVETITAYRFAFAGEDSDGTSGLSGYDLTDRTVIYSAQ